MLGYSSRVGQCGLETALTRQVVQKALVAATDNGTKSAAAAKFRNVVGAAAKADGLEYPPADAKAIKFVEFLSLFPDDLAFVRKAGSDLWVAPAKSPQLLTASEPDGVQSQVGIRRDMFEAFTRSVPDLDAWYDKEVDAVKWFPKSDNPGGFFKLPTADIALALQDRRAFAEQVTQPDLSKALLDELATPRGLTAFSAAIRENGLQPVWHQYWIKLLTKRIREWSTAVGLAWNNAWITSSTRGVSELVVGKTASPDVDREWKKSLSQLLFALSEQDLQRISIPLDLVVKAMRGN